MPTLQDDLRSADAVLTTHVLDMATGRPGRDVQIDLYRIAEDGREKLLSTKTNADGRCEAPLLTSADVEPGRYLLNFHAGAYLANALQPVESAGFFDFVPVEFHIGDPEGHYHVPLVVAPWGYSTYRGAPPERAPRDGRSGSAVPHPQLAEGPSAAKSPAPPPDSGSAGLTTHVIDIANGRGAGGLMIEVYGIGGQAFDWELLSRHSTTPEGRTSAWLVEGGALAKGAYELRFHLGDYFSATAAAKTAAPFFQTARVRFIVSDPDTHYHVPLLTAPWGYTAYRGS